MLRSFLMAEDVQDVPREERRRDYETTLVLSATANEEDRNTLVGKVQALIADEGGELIEVSPQKSFPLAYPILHERQGIMVSLVFRAASHVPERILSSLEHENFLLRHITVERPKAQKPRRTRASVTERTSPVSARTETKTMDEQIQTALTKSEGEQQTT